VSGVCVDAESELVVELSGLILDGLTGVVATGETEPSEVVAAVEVVVSAGEGVVVSVEEVVAFTVLSVGEVVTEEVVELTVLASDVPGL
jgi:hypothetical protein